jgi:hypothetical protein
MDGSNKWSPRKATAERYGVSTRTISRWERDPKMAFPEALLVNGRRYHRLADLVCWERARAKRNAS